MVFDVSVKGTVASCDLAIVESERRINTQDI